MSRWYGGDGREGEEEVLRAQRPGNQSLVIILTEKKFSVQMLQVGDGQPSKACLKNFDLFQKALGNYGRVLSRGVI